MGGQTAVSVIKAAKLAGVSRAQFYKDIDNKGISIDRSGKKPKVDISELIRVYGNNIKTPEKLAQDEEKKKHLGEAPSAAAVENMMELQSLRAELRHLAEIRQTEKAAAERHAGVQNQQIELLKSELEEKRRATVLLTDQRSEKEKQLAALQNELSTIKSAGFFARLFGFK